MQTLVVNESNLHVYKSLHDNALLGDSSIYACILVFSLVTMSYKVKAYFSDTSIILTLYAVF